MRITTSGHHVKITDSLRQYVESKLERLSKHSDHINQVHVVLSIEKPYQKAEATLHVKGMDIFADATHADLYAAIDALADKLDRQVIKHKEKLTARSHNSNPR